MQNGITESMTTGMTRPAKHSLVLLFTILLSVFMCQGLYAPNEAQAAEMNPDVGFNTPANWTVAQVTCGSGTCAGSINTGAGGNPSPFAQETASGIAKNGVVSYSYTENITPINAGAQVTAASLQGYMAATTGSYKTPSFTVQINDGGTWRTVLSSATDTGAAWGAVANTATLPVTTTGSTTQIRLTLSLASNTNGSVLDMRADNLSITYTPPAAPVPPSVVSGPTASNIESGTYLDSPFDLTARFNDNGFVISSCDYSLNNGGAWTSGTVSGSGATTDCNASPTCTNGTAMTILLRATNVGGTTNTTTISRTCDTVGPASGASFTATPGNTTCTLNWASTTDAGSGMHATEPYEVRQQLGSDPGTCSGGAQLYIGTALTTPHNGLTNGSTYFYRLCYKDNLLYKSEYSGNPITCVPVSGPPTLNPDGITAGTWTNEAGGALTPDKISDASDLTYAKTSTNGATFDASFSNDAAYSGKQIDNVRIYVRAYAAGEKIDWGPVIGGTPYLSGTQVTLTTTPTDYFKDWATNPQSGVNWTPAEVDALVARMSAIATGGMSEERVYKVWAVITYSEPVVSAINHNSTTTSSSKWPGNGGWGLAGTKYGEFVCATCHEPRATNIKSIKTTVTAPVGTFPGGAGSPVNFQSYTTSATDMGNDSGNTPRASSTRICEVCHTYDISGGSGVKVHPYSVGSALGNHYTADNTDCTGCHQHKSGFAKMACDGCHGNPPTAATFGGPDGLSDPDRTGSTIAGAHLAHVTTLSFACTNCHYGYTMPENAGSNPQTIDIGFNMWTKNGAGTTYGAADQVRVLDAYRGTNSTAIVNDNTRNCSNLYCHGNFTGGLNATPTWAGTAACGTCHANDVASAGSLNNSHPRHAGSGAGGISVACADCHNNGTAYTLKNGHVNGSVAWSLKTSDSRFGTNARYNALITGATGAVAPSASYQTCTNLYCHSNVQDGTATGGPNSYGGPRWGDASVTCTQGATGCHGNPPATPTANSAHTAHSGGTETYSYACSACHNNGGDESVNHANGTLNMTIDATYGGTYSQGDHAPGTGGYGSCSSVYCHSQGTSIAVPPAPNIAATWAGAMDATCTGCHSGNSAATNKMASNAHGTHINDTANQVGFSIGCAECHSATVSADRTILDAQYHVNKLMNIRFDNGTRNKNTDLPTYNALSAQSTVAGGATAAPGAQASCAKVYCHSIGNLDASNNPVTPASDFKTLAWNTATIGCSGCHGESATSKAHPIYATGAGGSTTANSHVAHVETMAYACDTCHNTTTTSAAIPPTTVLAAGQHLDRTEDVSFNTAGTSTWVPASKTCTTSKCHGSNSAAWGANTTTAQCVECHGVAATTPAGYTADTKLAAPGASNNTGVDTSNTVGTITRGVSNDTEVGAHYGHLYAQSGISSAIACTECHSVPANTVAGIKGHLDGLNADFTWGTLATKGGTMTPAFDAGTHTCSNNRCHNVATSNHIANPTDTTPTWNDTAYFGDVTTPLTATECNRCHYYSSTNDCNGCHNHVTAGAPNLSFITPSLHINGTVEASGGDCTGCHASAADNTDGGPTRRAVMGEFAGRGHLGANTAAACGVCHMEGNPLDGSINATYHKNNTLDFRDPDTGAPIKGVTFGGANPGSYSSTATDATAATFARNTTTATLEPFAQAVMVNLCLKCHDINGQNSGASYRVSGGTATTPFGAGAGTVMNVNDHFATGNATYHPVRGKQNNSYCNTNTMNAPYGVAKTPPSNTAYGVLMTCWDCHDSSATGRNITATTTAHGTSTFVRAPYDAVKPAATQICVVCHKTSVYWNGTTHTVGLGLSALNDDSPHAEWAAGKYHDTSRYYGCTVCHGMTTYGGVLPAIGSRSENVHGTNRLGNGNATWPSTKPPYSFYRNTGTEGDWNPATGTCVMTGCRGITRYYSPGGTY